MVELIVKISDRGALDAISNTIPGVVPTGQIVPLMPQPATANESLAHSQELERGPTVGSAKCNMDRISQGTRSRLTMLSNVQFIADEIWMEIFDWYAAQCCTFRAAAPESSALVLGQVCQQWRRLALSIPQLWNHLPVVHITRECLEQEHFEEGWREFLLRSGSLPLKLHLSFEIPVGEIPYRPYGALKPFLNCSTRWEHLTISGLMVMQTQVHLGLVHKNVPRLRSLTLNFARTIFDFVNSIKFDVFQFAPNLTEINLHSPSTAESKSHLSFPWNQLTSYKETGIDICTFPTMFRSTDLEVLRYMCKNFTHRLTEPMSHFNLRHLIVEVEEVRQFWRQLDEVTLPALETFSLRVHPCSADADPPQFLTLEDLIIRSGCPLKKLVLDTYVEKINPSELTALFSHLSDLESLELGTYFDDEFIQGILVALIFERNHATLLPRLRSLTLDCHDVPGDMTTVSQITASREKVIVDDASPGQLLASLEHLRIVLPENTWKYRTIYQVGGWEDPLKKKIEAQQEYLTPYASTIQLSKHINTLLLYAKKHHVERGSNLAPELLSLFTLAYLVEDVSLRRRVLNYLEELNMLSILQIHMVRNHWVPGCKEDILYVHPDRCDAIGAPGLWESIANAGLKRLGLLLGYHLVEEREDDLIEAVEEQPEDDLVDDFGLWE